ncbi:Inner membrane protein YgaP [compost metagenome]
MALKPISPEMARLLIDQGAVLVDIRAADEHAREHIAAARCLPLEKLAQGMTRFEATQAVIFHCRSGSRTRMNAVCLAACVACDTYVLEGGLDAWKRAGLPVVTDPRQPLELQRQVQIVAGSMVLTGAVLGAAVSPWFHLLSGFIGAGLVFAGVSGFCGLARVLRNAPWNRKATTS